MTYGVMGARAACCRDLAQPMQHACLWKARPSFHSQDVANQLRGGDMVLDFDQVSKKGPGREGDGADTQLPSVPFI